MTRTHFEKSGEYTMKALKIVLFVFSLIAIMAISVLAEGTVKIGLNYPKTGPYSVQGLDQWRATELAVAEESSSASEELASQAAELNQIVNSLTILVSGANKRREGISNIDYAKKVNSSIKPSNYYNNDIHNVADISKKGDMRKRVKPMSQKLVRNNSNVVIPLEDEEIADF